MSEDINKKIEDLQAYTQILCEKENNHLGRYVRDKLGFSLTNVTTELPGFAALVKQEIVINQNVEDIEKIILIVKNNLKYTVDYIIDGFKVNFSEIDNYVRSGIKNRDSGLKQYWANIAPILEEQKTSIHNKYADSDKQIGQLIQMIQNLIEPMFRLDSTLLIDAYFLRNNIVDERKKDNINFLLKKVYMQALPTNYKKLIYKELNTKSHKLDYIRIIRNAFKHGNYDIVNEFCIITKEELKGLKLSHYDLSKMFNTIFNIRIYCRTACGYILDTYMSNHTEFRNKANIHINTVTADINAVMESKGLRIEIKEDSFKEILKIDDNYLNASLSNKKLFFEIKILINNELCGDNENIEGYIWAIFKCYEELFPYRDISGDEVMCACYITDDTNFKTYIFSSFEEIDQILVKKLSISVLESLSTNML